MKKKIIICGFMLFCLNACKNEGSYAKIKTANVSSSPVKANDHSSDVVEANIATTQSEKGKPQYRIKIPNKNRSGSWPKIAQDFFLNQCMKDGAFMSKDQAKDYCNCMLTKIQDKFPNLKEAGKMTQKEAHVLSQSCLK